MSGVMTGNRPGAEAAHEVRYKAAAWLIWIGWSLLLGFGCMMALAAILFGRAPVGTLVGAWLGSRMLTAGLPVLVGTVWWIAYGFLLYRQDKRTWFRGALLTSMPLTLGTALPLLFIHLSDEVNHYFYYEWVHLNQPKSLSLFAVLLIATVLIQAAQWEYRRAGCVSLRLALRAVLDRIGWPLALVLLTGMAALQSLSYLDRVLNDFLLRYWPMSDAFLAGAPYPAAMAKGRWPDLFTAGGMSDYVIDLPAYPALVAVSFAVVGHNILAAYLPTVLSNILFVPAMALLFREVLGTKVMAICLTGVVALFPFLRFYVLNWPVPDSVFFTSLMLFAWLYVKVIRGERRTKIWVAFGLLGAMVTLTRPEGIAFTGALVLASMFAQAGMREKIAAACSAAIPVGLFSLLMMSTFGIPWPSNWTGTLGTHNVARNLETYFGGEAQILAGRMRMSVEELVAYAAVFLALSMLGSILMWRRHRLLPVLLIPAWVNLLVVFIIDPRVSGAILWSDLFRHIMYPVPLMALASGVALQDFVNAWPKSISRTAVSIGVNAVLVLVVLWNVHQLSKPSFSYGSDAGNLLGGSVRFNLVDLLSDHPRELPVYSFERSEGYWIPKVWDGPLKDYDERLTEYIAGFDPVGRASGIAYQSGSLVLFLAALGTSIASTAVRRITQ